LQPGTTQKSDWVPFPNGKWPRSSGDRGILVQNMGGDSFLIDQFKWIYWSDGSVWETNGSNNAVGWCISTESSDVVEFGSKAYEGVCKDGVKFYADGTSEWYDAPTENPTAVRRDDAVTSSIL
jgi:hypothetical protein